MKSPQTEQFVNPSLRGSLRHAECVRVGDAPHAFVTLSSPQAADSLKQLLTNRLPQLKVLGVHARGNETVLSLAGFQDNQELIDTFAAFGQPLSPASHKNKLTDPWLWRGSSSVVGQGLMLFSSRHGTGSKKDRDAVLGFAALNMLANITNIIFGSQKKDDPHQLQFVAEKIHTQLAPLAEENALPAPEEATKPLPIDPNHRRTFGEKAYDFAQKYSVSGGEIGLRVLGSLSMVFPITKWFESTGILFKTRSWKAAYEVAHNHNPHTFYAGIGMLVGKFTSMAAKEPDPYNPNPSSAIDTFREKVAFPLSSVIEAGATAYSMHDRFTRQKIKLDDVEHPDFLGGWGNAVFLGGYGIRFAAPYGSLNVNMKQLYAYTAQSLLQLPAEKREAAMLESAHVLAEHFNKPDTHSIGTLYAGIAEAVAKAQTQQTETPQAETPGVHIRTPAQAETVMQKQALAVH